MDRRIAFSAMLDGVMRLDRATEAHGGGAKQALDALAECLRAQRDADFELFVTDEAGRPHSHVTTNADLALYYIATMLERAVAGTIDLRGWEPEEEEDEPVEGSGTEG